MPFFCLFDLLGSLLCSFMPETSEKILTQLNAKKRELSDMHTFGLYESGNKVTDQPEILFARQDVKEVLEKVEAKKAAAKAAAQESTEVMAVEAAEPEIETALQESPQTDEIPAEDPGEPITVGNEPEDIEAAYNVTGVRRKELVAAVGDFIGAKPEYLRAPTYAFAVGSYNIDKEGTLTGPENPALIESLKEQGFIAAE